jgi:hypothetical protein
MNNFFSLPLMFILDNVLLTHETLVWVKKNNQEVVFMKLDFTKV